MREVKETVYIAISAVILALVIGLISIFLDIRSDVADARNSEIASLNNMQQYRQFNKYDDKIIYGDEVIELIKMHCDSEIEVYIDTPDGTSGPMRFNSQIIKADPTIISLEYLQLHFQTKREYRAQVVYNAIDPATIDAPMNKIQGSEVTGISLQWISNN